jgi:hypothetical protein
MLKLRLYWSELTETSTAVRITEHPVAKYSIYFTSLVSYF